MSRVALALALGIAMLAIQACGHVCGFPEPTPVACATPDPAWETAFTRDVGWTGADGAASIPLVAAPTLWLFGDTWIGPVRDGKHAPGSAMVNNTIALGPARQRGDDPAVKSMSFFWGPPDVAGKPTAWATPDHAGAGQTAEWFWPAGGGTVASDADGRGRLLVFMCRLGHKDTTDSIWNFEARGTTLLIIDNPLAPPEQWHQQQVPIAPINDPRGRQVTWGASVVDARTPARDLYVFGIDSSSVLDKKLILARVPAASIERFDTWQFWDGAAFSPGPEHAAPVASPLASELSMHRLWTPAGERFVMIYSELTLGPRVLCRTAAQPQGPWSEPVTLYDCPEPAADKNLMVYAAKAHPELSNPGELLISYCVNSTDFWDVAAHADKYRPRFIRVPVAMLPSAP